MNSQRRNSKNQNKNPGLALLVLVIFSLFSAVSGSALVVLLLILAVVAAVAVVAYFLGKKLKSGKGFSVEIPKVFTKEERQAEEYCKTCSDEFVYNNRQTEYNEHTQEESLRREKQRRLRQLDSFLKNGIIDHKEYQLLRARYGKDS